MIKLDKADVEGIKKLLFYTKMTHQEIANIYKVSRGHITKIKNEKRWKYDYRQKDKS
jgi:DNA invertase Pin-like site-specific DNA recombinase